MKPTARPGQIHNWSGAAHHISLLFLGHSNTNTQSQERSRLKTSPDFASNSCFKAQQVGLLQLPSTLSLQLGRMFNNATGVALLTYDNTYMAAPNYLLSKRQKMFVSGFVFDFSLLLVNNCCSSGRCFALLSPARDRTWEDRRKAQKQKNSWTR